MADHPHLALVLGSAPSVWDDLKRARRLVRGIPTLLVVTNHTGRIYEGHIDAWVTLHPELFEPWRAERAAKGYPTNYRALVYAGRKAVPNTEPYRQRWLGSSGLFAGQLALDVLGCAGAILCGVPIDREAGHIHAPGPWTLADRYRQGFHDAKAEGAAIRSMSGWSASVLGEPDGSWLRSLGFDVPASRRVPRIKPKEMNMRVRFIKDRNWTPPEERRMSVAYKAGMELTIKREWGEQLVRDGDAEVIDPPKRPKSEEAAGE